MTKISAAELQNEIRHVYQMAASLKSCRPNEIANERRLLLKSVDGLLPLFPKRSDDVLMARKVQALDYASSLIVEFAGR